MTKTIKIAFGADGLGTLECVGLGTFKVGGRTGLNYPKDITITPADKKGTHHSREHNVDMPYAILIWGQRGVYIHEWWRLEESAGCIHLMAGDAAKVYNFVDEKTRILISYPWRGEL